MPRPYEPVGMRLRPKPFVLSLSKDAANRQPHEQKDY